MVGRLVVEAVGETDRLGLRARPRDVERLRLGQRDELTGSAKSNRAGRVGERWRGLRSRARRRPGDGDLGGRIGAPGEPKLLRCGSGRQRDGRQRAPRRRRRRVSGVPRGLILARDDSSPLRRPLTAAAGDDLVTRIKGPGEPSAARALPPGGCEPAKRLTERVPLEESPHQSVGVDGIALRDGRLGPER